MEQGTQTPSQFSLPQAVCANAIDWIDYTQSQKMLSGSLQASSYTVWKKGAGGGIAYMN